jgi:hypothetical protein
VTVFQEYKRKHQINQKSVSKTTSVKAKRDQPEAASEHDNENSHRELSGIKGVYFKPPVGSWEDHIKNIDRSKEKDRSVNVYLTWQGGQKTFHTLDVVYKRCPQKLRYKMKLP